MRKTFSMIVALSALAFGCEQGDEVPQQIALDASPIFRAFPTAGGGRQAVDSRYAILAAEYLTSSESGRIGRTVFFRNVGNKQLAFDFVPGLSLDGTNNISFYIDESRPSRDVRAAASSASIARAMNTWEGVTCSQPSIYQVPSSKRVSTGYVSASAGFGGSFDYVADVVHAGWLPGRFFDLVDENGSGFILGVTFTIVFTDANGNLVDTDNNGKFDVAWREIYYNDAFAWADGTHIDIETVALHEAGHGLSQAHFGTAFTDAGTGKLHFSPLAVMNAAYSGIQTQISETDNGGHCSNWSNWPEN